MIHAHGRFKPSLMLSEEPEVQESDATKANSSIAAGNQLLFLLNYYSSDFMFTEPSFTPSPLHVEDLLPLFEYQHWFFMASSLRRNPFIVRLVMGLGIQSGIHPSKN